AVAVFGDEEIIPDQQRIAHRPGRNVERLKQKRADHEGDQQRMDHHAHGFGKPALFTLLFGRYAHGLGLPVSPPAWSVNHRVTHPPAWSRLLIKTSAFSAT